MGNSCEGVDEMTFEDKLKDIDRMIESFSNLSEKFPLSNHYKDTLRKFQQDRVELVDTLGRGKP